MAKRKKASARKRPSPKKDAYPAARELFIERLSARYKETISPTNISCGVAQLGHVDAIYTEVLFHTQPKAIREKLHEEHHKLIAEALERTVLDEKNEYAIVLVSDFEEGPVHVAVDIIRGRHNVTVSVSPEVFNPNSGNNIKVFHLFTGAEPHEQEDGDDWF